MCVDLCVFAKELLFGGGAVPRQESLCGLYFNVEMGVRQLFLLRKRDHSIGVCIGVCIRACIGHASGTHRGTHQVITLAVKLGEGGFDMYIDVYIYIYICLYVYT